MSAISRGFRNVYRNKFRTAVVMVILAMSIAVFLTMVIVDEGVKDGIENTENNMDTNIEIRPAGSFGGFSKRPGGGGGGGGTTEIVYLDDGVNDYVRTIPEVESTSRTLTHVDTESFSMYSGIDPGTPLTGMDGSLSVVINGSDMAANAPDDRVAVVSSSFADGNAVEVDDFITVNGTSLKVVGIFSSETKFGNRTTYVPIETLQDIYELEGSYSQLTVTVDSPENVDEVYDELRTILASDELDVVHPGEENANLVDSLETISDSSAMGAIVALAVGCVIVFFIMMLVTRERRKEIGTLKALGASDGDVLKQLMVEAMTIAIVGAAIGLLVAAVGGNVIADAMVGGDSQDDSSSAPSWLSGNEKQRFSQRETTISGDSDTEDVMSSISYGLSLMSTIYAFGAAILIGGLGILYPAIQAIRMQPVEALRHE
jgi:putative ABC transport system permease protein